MVVVLASELAHRYTTATLRRVGDPGACLQPVPQQQTVGNDIFQLAQTSWRKMHSTVSDSAGCHRKAPQGKHFLLKTHFAQHVATPKLFFCCRPVINYSLDECTVLHLHCIRKCQLTATEKGSTKFIGFHTLSLHGFWSFWAREVGLFADAVTFTVYIGLEAKKQSLVISWQDVRIFFLSIWTRVEFLMQVAQL